MRAASDGLQIDACVLGAPPPPQDLDSLSTLPRLKYLSLLDNPVTKQVRGAGTARRSLALWGHQR